MAIELYRTQAYTDSEVMHMKRSFNIIDGIVYVDKSIYQEAQLVDNNVSKLTGSTCMNLFKTKPIIKTGIESVTIDFSSVEGIGINKDPVLFVEELRATYNGRIRGHLVVDVGDDHPVDININSY